MSVNFYARATDAPSVDPALVTAPAADPDGLHIGQARAHNEFLMRAHPELGLTTVVAWRDLLAQSGIAVWAESGYKVSLPDLLQEVTNPRFRCFGRRQQDFRDEGAAFTNGAFR